MVAPVMSTDENTLKLAVCAAGENESETSWRQQIYGQPEALQQVRPTCKLQAHWPNEEC